MHRQKYATEEKRHSVVLGIAIMVAIEAAGVLRTASDEKSAVMVQRLEESEVENFF